MDITSIQISRSGHEKVKKLAKFWGITNRLVGDRVINEVYARLEVEITLASERERLVELEIKRIHEDAIRASIAERDALGDAINIRTPTYAKKETL